MVLKVYFQKIPIFHCVRINDSKIHEMTNELMVM